MDTQLKRTVKDLLKVFPAKQREVLQKHAREYILRIDFNQLMYESIDDLMKLKSIRYGLIQLSKDADKTVTYLYSLSIVMLNGIIAQVKTRAACPTSAPIVQVKNCQAVEVTPPTKSKVKSKTTEVVKAKSTSSKHPAHSAKEVDQSMEVVEVQTEEQTSSKTTPAYDMDAPLEIQELPIDTASQGPAQEQPVQVRPVKLGLLHTKTPREDQRQRGNEIGRDAILYAAKVVTYVSNVDMIEAKLSPLDIKCHMKNKCVKCRLIYLILPTSRCLTSNCCKSSIHQDVTLYDLKQLQLIHDKKQSKSIVTLWRRVNRQCKFGISPIVAEKVLDSNFNDFEAFRSDCLKNKSSSESFMTTITDALHAYRNQFIKDKIPHDFQEHVSLFGE